MFTVGMGLMGTFYSGIKANSLDLAPNYAGVVLAISNGTGSLGKYIARTVFFSQFTANWHWWNFEFFK